VGGNAAARSGGTGIASAGAGTPCQRRRGGAREPEARMGHLRGAFRVALKLLHPQGHQGKRDHVVADDHEAVGVGLLVKVRVDCRVKKVAHAGAAGGLRAGRRDARGGAGLVLSAG
jgi:hypothetical protein